MFGYRYFGDGDTNQRKILLDDAHRSRTDLLPFWGRCPHGDPQTRNFGPKFWPLDREYLENGIVAALRASLTSARRQLLKL